MDATDSPQQYHYDKSFGDNYGANTSNNMISEASQNIDSFALGSIGYGLDKQTGRFNLGSNTNS